MEYCSCKVDNKYVNSPGIPPKRRTVLTFSLHLRLQQRLYFLWYRSPHYRFFEIANEPVDVPADVPFSNVLHKGIE